MTPRAVWQLTGGLGPRSYADVFLQYGVGLIGPGDAGPWTPARNDDEFGGGVVRRFAKEVAVGDVFLLRTGISKVCAVGIVASGYLFLNQFDDVNGWDLQHGRRVRWYKLPEEQTFTFRVFGSNPSRFSRVWNEDVLDYTRRFLNSPPTSWQTAALPDLPEEEPLLQDVPAPLEGFVALVNDLLPLFWDRQGFGDHPSEDEMITHLVVPFLRTMGWPPEHIAVKWRNIDVAVFQSLPRTPENCRLVIEVKRLGASVEGALEQAKGYVEAMGVPRDIVVTDGIRYRLYACEGGFAPAAYANLGRLKKSAINLFERMKSP